MVVGALMAALMVNGGVGGPRGGPSTEGLANFGRVDGTLMRGTQPDERGIENLKRLGVATIINLRMADDVWPGEAAAARRLHNGRLRSAGSASGVKSRPPLLSAVMRVNSAPKNTICAT